MDDPATLYDCGVALDAAGHAERALTAYDAALALRLARDPALLKSLREKLAANRPKVSR